jgi:hypothetical protein
VNETLTRLDLTNNFITDPGAQALAEALEKNRVLVALCMGHNRLTRASIAKLLKLVGILTLDDRPLGERLLKVVASQVRQKGSCLMHVSLEGVMGSVLLRSEMERQLTENTSTTQAGRQRVDERLLLHWRRGREPCRNASAGRPIGPRS